MGQEHDFDETVTSEGTKRKKHFLSKYLWYFKKTSQALGGQQRSLPGVHQSVMWSTTSCPSDFVSTRHHFHSDHDENCSAETERPREKTSQSDFNMASVYFH
jgi:hypothetical protein